MAMEAHERESRTSLRAVAGFSIMSVSLNRSVGRFKVNLYTTSCGLVPEDAEIALLEVLCNLDSVVGHREGSSKVSKWYLRATSID